MSFLLIALVVVGIVVGSSLRKQGQAAGNAVLAVSCLLGVGVAVGRLVSTATAPKKYEVVQEDIHVTQQAMAEELGRYLAEASAGTTALCLLNPSEASNHALRAGLTEGLGEGVSVAFEEVNRADDPRQQLDTVELSVPLVRANLERHPGSDLLICMSDLPRDGRRMAAFLKQQKVRLAAGNVFDRSSLAPFFRSGVFAGAAVYRDDATEVADIRRATSAEIFESLYLLVPARK